MSYKGYFSLYFSKPSPQQVRQSEAWSERHLVGVPEQYTSYSLRVFSHHTMNDPFRVRQTLIWAPLQHQQLQGKERLPVSQPPYCAAWLSCWTAKEYRLDKKEDSFRVMTPWSVMPSWPLFPVTARQLSRQVKSQSPVKS